MGQVLHGSARTTEVARRAAQHSEGSLRALARRYHLSLNPEGRSVIVTGGGAGSTVLAEEGAMARDGVRVDAVLPAEVATPLHRSWLDAFDDPDGKLAGLTARFPPDRRLTTDRKIADMVVFLLSGRSSPNANQWIVPDGVYTHFDRALD